MAFFYNWQEKRIQTGKWLITIIMSLLCLLQAFTLFVIFHNTKISYKNNISFTLLDKTSQACLTKSASAPFAIYSYSYIDHTIHIKKPEQSIDTVFHFSEGEDTKLLLCQADYDIRDTSIWCLDSLGALLEQTFATQKFVPPYTLMLTDSDGKVLDQYQHGKSALSLWTVRQEIPLGFLEHHLLTAKFIYPVSYFWEQVWDKIITTLGLFILLILTTITLFIQLRNERKTSEFRKKFTHTLVHNLRSPLILLKHQLEMLETLHLSPEEQHTNLERCQEKTSKVLKDIEHLLSVSVNAYGLLAHCEMFSLTPLLRKISEEYQQKLSGKKVTISLDQQLDHPIYADPLLLEGALGNLIGNSVKYSGADTLIRISCREEKKKIIMTITDNGYGIPPEEQQQVFRENYRGRKYMTDKEHKGFGLGLYYVQAVATAHGGHISVRSDGQHGSEFTIEIPQRNRKR